MLGAMAGILSLEQRAFDDCSQQGDPGSWAGSRRQETCPAQGPHECPLAAAKHTQGSAFVSGCPPHASSSSEEEERRCSERQCVDSVEAVDIVNIHGLEGIGGGPDYLWAPRRFWSILPGPEIASGFIPIPV